MKDDYLWDGSGEPDPEIHKLELLLGRFRHHQPAPNFTDIAPAAAPRPVWKRTLRRWLFPAFAAVAAMALLIVTVSHVLKRRQPLPVPQPGWDVARLSGTPRVGPTSISGERGTARLEPGQTLVTDSSSRASLRIEGVGQVEVEPGTRLRLVRTASIQKWLSLERGAIHASIWAPPGEFVVDTPSAVAVDLGCAYTLNVDDSGAGLLRTSLGWVGFKLDGHESFIPAGAACATRPNVGPGTPYYEDAPAQLREALAKLDFGNIPADQRSRQLTAVLSLARKRDALTVWHLLGRVNQSERRRVYDRLAQLVPPPRQVTQEGILNLDQNMLDAWWNELGLGDTALWRTWERAWPER